MDTHNISHPTIDEQHASIQARLPGEVEASIDAANPEHSAIVQGGEQGSSSHDAGVRQPVIEPIEADGRLPTSAAPRVPRRKHKLLVTGAVIAVAAVGVGAFTLSPYNTVYPMPRLVSQIRAAAASAGLAVKPLVAPAASLASVTLAPEQPAPVRESFVPKPKEQQVNELLALQRGVQSHAPNGATSSAPATSTRQMTASHASTPGLNTPNTHVEPAPQTTVSTVAPADTTLPPGGFVGEPGSGIPVSSAPAGNASSTPAASTSVPPIALRRQAAPPPSATPGRLLDRDLSEALAASSQKQALIAPSSVNTPLPTTPVATMQDAKPAAPAATVPTTSLAPRGLLENARDLRADPMAPPEQVKVLNMVTEMAAMVRDMRLQDAQLRSDFKKFSADMSNRLADTERRLALKEAIDGVAAARDAGLPPAVPGQMPAIASTAAPTLVAATPLPTTGRARPEAARIATSGSSQVRYRVQAASPGLALLAQVDRGGGEGAQLQVSVGDTVPGYGVVKSIGQKGSSWAVNTERGAIE